ncbi:diacylglycerol acyltransferase [Sporodiniella umbellata]|nr:diacylglycerol acyltransferase [Sporodiniella umbellata]
MHSRTVLNNSEHIAKNEPPQRFDNTWENKFQTFCVVSFLFMLIICCLVFAISLSYTFMLPFSLMYVAYILIDKTPENGGRYWFWIRDLYYWKYVGSYFPLKLIKEVDLDPSENYIFGYHPHGIIGVGAILNFATESTNVSKIFSGFKFSTTTLNLNFKIPFFRDIILATGIVSVSRRSCDSILSSGPGRILVILVGGATESLKSCPGTADLNLKSRLGFIKMAIRHQVKLVPVFSFGENDIYDQVNLRGWKTIEAVQKALKGITGFTIPLFYGRGIFNYKMGFTPYRVPIVTITGRPIPVPKLEKGQEPTEEQILATQALYIEELQSIYEKYKDVYAKNRKKELCIVN